MQGIKARKLIITIEIKEEKWFLYTYHMCKLLQVIEKMLMQE